MAGLESQQATIAAVWDQHRPTMIARVDLLERAQREPSLRTEAREAAHQLAGTVGTFGFPRASELARRCEMLLASTADASEMASLVSGIRDDISVPPFVAPDPVVDDLEPARMPLVLMVCEEPGLGEALRAEAGRCGLRSPLCRVGETRGRMDREMPDAVLVDLRAPEAEDQLVSLRRDHPELVFLTLDPGSTPGETIDAVARALARHQALREPVLVLAPDLRPMLAAAGLTLGEEDPALVVLDDLERCRALRADRRMARISIVAVGDLNVREAFAAGVDDVLRVDDDLPDRLRRHLEIARAREAARGGLPDRRGASLGLSRLLRLGERLDKSVCVARIQAPPAELRDLGAMLRRTLRSEDVVGRWGENELVVGMFNVARDAASDRLGKLLKGTVARAGITQFPTDGADLEALHRAVDTTLDDGADHSQITAAGAENLTTQVDVAIIEDEDATSELIANALTARGLRCFQFSNGGGAISMLLGEQPRVRARVLLVDLNLPVVSGMELLTVFSREGVLRATHAIVVSAHDDLETIRKARSLGAEDYIVKPIDLDVLIAKVDEALGRRD